VGIQVHEVASNYFKKKVPVLTIFGRSPSPLLSLFCFERSQRVIRDFLFTSGQTKRALLCESSQIHSSRLMLISTSNPKPPCKEELKSLHLHHTQTQHEWWLHVNHSFPSDSFFIPNTIVSYIALSLRRLPITHVWSLLHYSGDPLWQLNLSVALSHLLWNSKANGI
jgi:hypothetical protein